MNKIVVAAVGIAAAAAIVGGRPAISYATSKNMRTLKR